MLPDKNIMRGFTLTEVLIVLAIILIVSAASLPLMSNWSFDAKADGVRSEIVNALRLSRERSLAGFGNEANGIKLMKDRYIIFRGKDYASRKPDYDLEIKLSKSTLIDWRLTGEGQADEIVFSAYKGEVNRSGKISVVVGDTSADIILNQSGFIE
jgi:prepilin-type N-terminal cleavage/methylation domain-containing protein